MAFNNSPLAFGDLIRELDKALASKKGLRMTFPAHEDAMRFKGRFHSFRFQHRKANAALYPADHPMHGNSEYDALAVKTVSPTVIDLMKVDAIQYASEELPDE